MRVGLKLIAVVAVAATTLLLVIGVSSVIGAHQLENLQDIEGRLVPKLELGPALDAEFQRLRQSLQDAAAAQEPSSLDAAAGSRARLFELIAGSSAVLRPEQAASLRWAVNEYYEQARGVAKRMIAGEAGEQMVADMAGLQLSYQRAATLIQNTTRLRPNELAVSFAAIAQGSQRAQRWSLLLCCLGLFAIVGLSWWTGKQVLGGLARVSGGLARFSTGDFAVPIALQGKDELAAVARDANAMAASLSALDAERKRDDWLRTSAAELWDELRGELDPSAVARRSLAFLAKRLGAQAGVVYLTKADCLSPAGGYAARVGSGGEPTKGFKIGEGLVGEAARTDGITELRGLAAPQLRLSSGLVDAEPHSLLLLPLSSAGSSVGLLELLFLGEPSDKARQLLESVARHLAIAIQSAKYVNEQRALLEQTQEQAARLTAQEEELRLNNHELHAQQQELQRINGELENQRQQLQSQNVELMQARQVVQQKASEVERVSAYKTQFLANMSHELRTPLNSMLLLSHLLSENESGNLSAKQVEHSKTIHAAGQDLLGLINQVLDLAKIEAGKQEVELDVVEISQLCGYVRRVFQPLADDKGLKLELDVASDVGPTLVSDAKRLEGVLTNLIGNAIKFTERGGVKLSIGRPAPSVRFTREGLSHEQCLAFSVTDTGVGIASADVERVFHPFEQVEGHANRRYAGTGLGLAIARETVALLGGELQLESKVGVGSTFRCLLPHLALPKRPSSRASADPAIGDDRALVTPGEPHLLIIEDDAVVVEQLVSMVRARRVKAVAAGTGEEGLRLARALQPTGIVLDIKLPDADGWRVIEQLRADARTQGIPVHFISGIEARERGLELGAIGYLTKPASHAEMARMVRSLTPGVEATSRRVLVVEDDAVQGAALLAVLRSQHLEGTHVTSAEAALAHLESAGAGCVILDLGLPDMDGLRLLELLRGNPRIAEPPRIVVHTGRALTKKETRQLEAYSEAVILKDEQSIPRLLEQMRLFVRQVGTTRDAPPAGPISERPDAALVGAKILLAEDDMRTVYALSALLRGKGAEVIVAENGREAVELAAEHPDLRGILMDIMMPEVDGYEAIRRLRTDPRFATVPIVALTARAMKGERERCLETGASDYLTKPVDHQELLAVVRGWRTVSPSP